MAPKDPKFSNEQVEGKINDMVEKFGNRVPRKGTLCKEKLQDLFTEMMEEAQVKFKIPGSQKYDIVSEAFKEILRRVKTDETRDINFETIEVIDEFLGSDMFLELLARATKAGMPSVIKQNIDAAVELAKVTANTAVAVKKSGVFSCCSSPPKAQKPVKHKK